MLDKDTMESLRQIDYLYSHATTAKERRKLEFIKRNITTPTRYIKDMREALIRAKKNQNLDEVKDIQEWVATHKSYQNPIYEKDG